MRREVFGSNACVHTEKISDMQDEEVSFWYECYVATVGFCALRLCTVKVGLSVFQEIVCKRRYLVAEKQNDYSTIFSYSRRIM